MLAANKPNHSVGPIPPVEIRIDAPTPWPPIIGASVTISRAYKDGDPSWDCPHWFRTSMVKTVVEK